MTIPKKYFHDRIILLLVSANAFLAILTSIMIALKLGDGRTNHLVQFQSNLDQVSRYKYGGVSTFYSFMLFAVFVMIFNTILSIRVYHIRRHFSVAILAMTSLLLVLTLVVSYALLFNNR